jgi:hypothetical protein
MAQCPVCQTPGAYVGFSSVECRNPQCEHFVLVEEHVCPCCGKPDHTPEEGWDGIMRRDSNGNAVDLGLTTDVADPLALS